MRWRGSTNATQRDCDEWTGEALWLRSCLPFADRCPSSQTEHHAEDRNT
jgi:hypothetical protein